jgi:hypothetical protein
MDLYMTQDGRQIKPEFPADLAAWPELAEAVENARRLEREHTEALAAQSAAETALKDAIAADRGKLAEAKLAGRKQMPKPEGVEQAKAVLEEAERQRNAADDARRRGAQLVLETLETHRPAWALSAQEIVERARREEALALSAWLEAVQAVTVARATAAWISEFPEKRGYAPSTPHLRHVGRHDPIPFGDVVNGLKIRCGLADPPPRTLLERQAATRKRAEEATAA